MIMKLMITKQFQSFLQELGIDITYLLTGQEERNNISNYIERCPKEKRYDFEQLIKYALNLVNVK